LAEAGVIYAASNETGALRQGELLSGLVLARRRLDTIAAGQPVVLPIQYPWAVVMSQDCDLDWDHRSRQEEPEPLVPDVVGPPKQIPNILFCEAMEAEDARARVDKRTWDRIKINKDERYHFLQKVSSVEDALGNQIPELCLDFKRYFTVPTTEVYLQLTLEARRRCVLNPPYLQHLCTRFFYFQSRVALPEEHFSEPAAGPSSA
jgi:hypothetical protein